MYHDEVLPENVTEYFMRQLVHVVFQLTGSAVAVPAAAAAAAADHRLEVSGFLPGTHWYYDTVHSEKHADLSATSGLRYFFRPGPAAKKPHQKTSQDLQINTLNQQTIKGTREPSSSL